MIGNRITAISVLIGVLIAAGCATKRTPSPTPFPTPQGGAPERPAQPREQPTPEAEAEGAGSGGRPTHLLFENSAFALGAEPLSLGTQAVAGERWIGLDPTMAGVSRKHCELLVDNGQCVVRDFSRYGTFLNGHRMDGTAVLQVGDLIRLGTPGYELRLITTEASDGA